MGAGADWVRAAYPAVKVSEFGATVADILADWQRGIYHMNYETLKKADWSDERCLAFKIENETGGLATCDFDGLTHLVLQAHFRCVRIALHPAGTRKMLLVFHPRSRTGGFSARHPTIEEAIESFMIGREPLQPIEASQTTADV